MSNKLNDESIMPYGTHKGKTLANIPDSYFVWAYENDKCSDAIKEYIEENADVLKIKVNKKK